MCIRDINPPAPTGRTEHVARCASTRRLPVPGAAELGRSVPVDRAPGPPRARSNAGRASAGAGGGVAPPVTRGRPGEARAGGVGGALGSSVPGTCQRMEELTPDPTADGAKERKRYKAFRDCWAVVEVLLALHARAPGFLDGRSGPNVFIRYRPCIII